MDKTKDCFSSAQKAEQKGRKHKGLIDYDDEFIDRITVYNEKDEKTDVDLREEARYGASVLSEGIIEKYDFMMDICKKCISQAEDIIYSDKEFKVPEELLKFCHSVNCAQEIWRNFKCQKSLQILM